MKRLRRAKKDFALLDFKYHELLKKARQTNKERDAIDREMGQGSPHDGDLLMLLHTAIEAIRAGLKVDDMSCIYEGLAMLMDDPRIKWDRLE